MFLHSTVSSLPVFNRFIKSLIFVADVIKYLKFKALFLLQYFQRYETYLMWCAWWVGLGVLSSVGFGTGLHTFLLYLGPHIAAVILMLIM
jgi:hypothetical protein